MSDSSRTLDLKSDPGYIAILSLMQAKEEIPMEGLDGEYRGCMQSDLVTVENNFKNPERLSELMDYGLVQHILLRGGERSSRYELTEDGRRAVARYNRAADARTAKLQSDAKPYVKPVRGVSYGKPAPKTSKTSKRPSVSAKGSRDEPID